jgi:hypothetical protein
VAWRLVREGKHDAARQWIGVWAASASDAWIITSQGELLRWNGSTVASMGTLSSGRSPSAIWGSSSTDIWIVGAQGLIAHWDGQTLSEQASPTTQSLWSVSGTSGSDVWVVGEGGTVMRFNGAGWVTLNAPLVATLGPIVPRVGMPGHFLVAAGARVLDAVLTGATATWSQLGTVPGTASVTAIAAAGPTVWAGTRTGQLLFWDGTSWITTTSPANVGTVHTLHVAGALVFALAQRDSLVRLGTTWRSMLASSSLQVGAPVLAFDGTRVFATGQGGFGLLARVAPHTWVPVPGTSAIQFRLVCGPSNGTARGKAVSGAGTVYSFDENGAFVSHQTSNTIDLLACTPTGAVGVLNDGVGNQFLYRAQADGGVSTVVSAARPLLAENGTETPFASVFMNGNTVFANVDVALSYANQRNTSSTQWLLPRSSSAALATNGSSVIERTLTQDRTVWNPSTVDVMAATTAEELGWSLGTFDVTVTEHRSDGGVDVANLGVELELGSVRVECRGRTCFLAGEERNSPYRTFVYRKDFR